MKFTLVAVGENIAASPYLYKLSCVLSQLGNFQYVYWDRSQDNGGGERLSHIAYRRIFCFAPAGKVSMLAGYVGWLFSLTKYFLFEADDSRLYFVSRLDAAAPIMFASFFRPSLKYVYLDRDAYHMTYNLGVFRGWVKKIETKVALRAELHFVPGAIRNFTQASNVRVIENTPDSRAFFQAKERSALIAKSDRFKIYVNGWLVDTRGAKIIFECAKKLDSDKYEIIVAGPELCTSIKELVELPIVTYLGQLDNISALSYYFVSDVVFSFYDPAIEVNRKAEPNKWYDCVFTGTKFISNYGIETVAPFVRGGLCTLIEYNDAESLLKEIQKMRDAMDSISPLCTQKIIKDMGLDYWDVKVASLLKCYLNG